MHPRSWIWLQTVAPQKKQEGLVTCIESEKKPGCQTPKTKSPMEKVKVLACMSIGKWDSHLTEPQETGTKRPTFWGSYRQKEEEFRPESPSYIKHIDWASCILKSWGLVTPRHRTHASSKVSTGYPKAMSIEHQPQDTTHENDLPGKGYFRIPGFLYISTSTSTRQTMFDSSKPNLGKLHTFRQKMTSQKKKTIVEINIRAS